MYIKKFTDLMADFICYFRICNKAFLLSLLVIWLFLSFFSSIFLLLECFLKVFWISALFSYSYGIHFEVIRRKVISRQYLKNFETIIYSNIRDAIVLLKLLFSAVIVCYLSYFLFIHIGV